MQPQNEEALLTILLIVLVRILEVRFINWLSTVVQNHFLTGSVHLVISYREPKVLQVDSDLVSAASLWEALEHRGVR